MLPWRVGLFVGALTAGAGAVAVVTWNSGTPSPASPPWLALPVLGLLLFAATWFVVPFRYARSVDAINLIEAALAPLLIAFPPAAVIAVTAVSQIANGTLRKLPWVKTLHNTAMWSLGAGLAAAVVSAMGTMPVWPDAVLAIVAGLTILGLVNNVAVGTVLTLADGGRLAEVASRVLSITPAAWLGTWVVNTAFGLLFALAFVAAPIAVVVSFVPLVVLHLAYRSYAAARADHTRLSAAHRAAAQLWTPLYPQSAIESFLRDVTRCFDAAAVELVLRNDEGTCDIHRFVAEGQAYSTRVEALHAASLQGAVLGLSGAAALSALGTDMVSRALAGTGAHSCLAAPLLQGERVDGALLVLDRAGFAGSRQGELAVLAALARETSGALARGRLLADVLDERRKFAEVLESTSDGICAVNADGTVRTWNPAMERITGLLAEDVIGTGDIAARLRARTVDGELIDVSTAVLATLPQDLLITAGDGTTRHLNCSYSESIGQGEGAALVAIARDVTPAKERAELRKQVNRLVAEDSARRTVVEQLQSAVVPAPLRVDGAELAASYVASDPTSPTGGDLYDWQLLPSGEVHIAVVDVLGHGVAATKDALAVVHTLRVVTAAGTPLGEVVARADELLRVQHPDLVATVLVARYDPSSGRLLVASGGHPPAIVVTPAHKVRQVPATGGVIGWPGAGSDGVAETRLEPGDAMVLYTDGLVEARKNILDGIKDLERHAREVANLPAPELASELVRRALDGADRRDDTLALVLRRDFVRAADQRCSWTITPDAADARELRHQLAAWLAERNIEAADAVLAAAELLSNAVRAAVTRVRLHVKLTGTSLVIDVTDDGVPNPLLDDAGRRLPPGDGEAGRGLYIVRSLSSRVDVLVTDEMTMVRAVLPLRPSSSATSGAVPNAVLRSTQ